MEEATKLSGSTGCGSSTTGQDFLYEEWTKLSGSTAQLRGSTASIGVNGQILRSTINRSPSSPRSSPRFSLSAIVFLSFKSYIPLVLTTQITPNLRIRTRG